MYVALHATYTYQSILLSRELREKTSILPFCFFLFQSLFLSLSLSRQGNLAQLERREERRMEKDEFFAENSHQKELKTRVIQNE